MDPNAWHGDELVSCGGVMIHFHGQDVAAEGVDDALVAGDGHHPGVQLVPRHVAMSVGGIEADAVIPPEALTEVKARLRHGVLSLLLTRCYRHAPSQRLLRLKRASPW